MSASISLRYVAATVLVIGAEMGLTFANDANTSAVLRATARANFPNTESPRMAVRSSRSAFAQGLPSSHGRRSSPAMTLAQSMPGLSPIAPFDYSRLGHN
jgi:hypothetical protein